MRALGRAIVRQATKDEEFEAFLETFKKKEGNNFKKIIDATTDEKAAIALAKTRKER